MVSLSQGPVTTTLPSEIVNQHLQDTKQEKSLFFINRTVVISPEILQLESNTEYIVWETNRRPTSTNAVKKERTIAEDKYTFSFDPSEDIIIRYRTANTPIWYVIAVGATIVGMIMVYLVAKQKNASKDV
jgi:hypothetical protein